MPTLKLKQIEAFAIVDIIRTLNFFLSFIYFTSFGEKDKADMNSLRWSAPVGLEPAYTHM